MNINQALQNAKKFNAGRRWNRVGKIPLDPILLRSPSVCKAIEGMVAATGSSREVCEDAVMRAHNLGEILTVEELAARLKVDPAWVKHRRRSRCKNKIPALDVLGRPLRFDWDTIVKWLEAGPEEDNGRNGKPSRKKRA